MGYSEFAAGPNYDDKTLPTRIAEHFIARIFTGEFTPGQRLPPDRELATRLGVDRTSLRMAMQQLSRMGLVKAVRGSGVCVLDYRESAGIDFLAAVFALPQLEVGGSFLLQSLDDWMDFMPVVVGRALARATPQDHREIDAMFAEQLAHIDAGSGDFARVVAIEVAMQDRVVRMVGNIGLALLNNSSRPLRMRVAKLFFDVTEPRSHVETQRAMVRRHMKRRDRAAVTAIEEITQEFRAYLRETNQPLQDFLQTLPVNPVLLPDPAGAHPKPDERLVEAPRARPKPNTPNATPELCP